MRSERRGSSGGLLVNIIIRTKSAVSFRFCFLSLNLSIDRDQGDFFAACIYFVNHRSSRGTRRRRRIGQYRRFPAVADDDDNEAAAAGKERKMSRSFS